MNFNLEEDDLRSILEDLEIEIAGETGTDFLCLCPFHDNSVTPAFNISKEVENNLWRCWNSSCGKSGSILSLIQEIKSYSPVQSIRYLTQRGMKRQVFVRKTKEVSYSTIPESILQNFLPPDSDVVKYLYRRGFTERTVEYFQVGTDSRAIIVPVRNETGNLVGFTRRMTFPSRNKYLDPGLPKRFLLFNLQNASSHDEVIISEGPLDAMKIQQAGFPNVVATMMGDLTDFQQVLLKKFFKSVIIFTDRDPSGQSLGGVIAEKCKGLDIYWANIPNGYKDAGEMNDSQISKAIEDKKSNLEMKLINRRFSD